MVPSKNINPGIIYNCNNAPFFFNQMFTVTQFVQFEFSHVHFLM